jgi:hypothetical protein
MFKNSSSVIFVYSFFGVEVFLTLPQLLVVVCLGLAVLGSYLVLAPIECLKIPAP